MHEMSIAQSVVEICEGYAGNRKVLDVVLEIGALSGVESESIEFCFEACSKGTVLEGATLRLEIVPGLAKCPGCSHEVQVDDLFTPCPECGSFGLTILTGQELRVKEFGVE